MSEDKTRILNMLKEGTISVDEADQLLDALDRKDSIHVDSSDLKTGKRHPKYLRIQVMESFDEVKKEKVNIKIPLGIVRAGVKLGALIPDNTRDEINKSFNAKGMHLGIDDFNSENIEDLIQCLTEMNIDIDDGKDTVRIFCE